MPLLAVGLIVGCAYIEEEILPEVRTTLGLVEAPPPESTDPMDHESVFDTAAMAARNSAPKVKPKRSSRAAGRTVQAARRAAPPGNDAKVSAPLKTPSPRPPDGAELPAELLVGLSKTRIQSVFGAPNVHKEVIPAHVWYYAVRGCTLKVYFYPDLKSGTYRALHYEVTFDGPFESDKRDCVAEVLARAQPAF